MATVVRGCGRRVQAGAYLEVPTSPRGRDISDFLVDPPRPADAEALGLSSIGVRLIPDVRGREVAPGIPLRHVYDVVGLDGYPNVADFVEEARRHGVSRRISSRADFSGLGPGSRLLLFHRRAYDESWPRLAWSDSIGGRPWTCPRKLTPHRGPAPIESMCAGLWWHDVQGGDWLVADGRRSYVRRIGDVEYEAGPRPLDVGPRYKLALFASFPIAKVAVIRADDGSHEAAEHATRRSSIPVVVEED